MDHREGTTERTLEADLRAIEGEFAAAMGDAPRVAQACERLRARLGTPLPDPEIFAGLLSLAPLLRKRVGAIAAPLFALLHDAALASPDPWSVLSGLVAARDPDLRSRALDSALELARRGEMSVDRRVASDLAALTGGSDPPLADPGELHRVGEILRAMFPPPFPGESDPVAGLYASPGDPSLRRLAAGILDSAGEPAPAEIRERLLGGEAEAFLTRYLDYTRASHRDLLDIAGEDGSPPPCLASLRHAQEACGEKILREAIAALGWPRVNLGIGVSRRIPVTVGGAFPLLLSPSEAQLLDGFKPARRLETKYLLLAHGGSQAETPGSARGVDPVGRFRGYNLAHAEVLSEILSIAPLSRDRVERILDAMDRITEDFVGLFARYDEECAALPRLYADLRGRVSVELESAVPGRPLTAELTRLVQMFEDPKNLSEVRTLHGLKRYLHQKGLRLGFNLVDSGRATNRTVDLVLATRDRILAIASRIVYIDFEPETNGGATGGLPYPVRVVAEGFARQLIQGEGKLPDVKVFCYGNEVHYYISFGNHPAFLRIDYSPPLRGGMIDLEYYGVSKNEMSEHPAPDLPAIRSFLQRLDFDAKVANTRIHARYDKERAVDLADLCERVEALFRLAPYLMDVDWTIGSLRLNGESQRDVAAAWCDFFLRWGVLPVGQFLTRDRQGILVGLEIDSTGRERETAWSGERPYRDRFTVPAPEGLLAHIDAALRAKGIWSPITVPADGEPDLGQLPLERSLLGPLRSAVERGEIVEGPDGFSPAGGDLYEPIHAARYLAGLLASDEDENLRIESAARFAALVAPLERTLHFHTTGSVNGYEVQRARLSLRGGWIFLHVLCDGSGMTRLAISSRDESPCRRRRDAEDPWAENLSTDGAGFAALLRQNGYLTPGLEPGSGRGAAPDPTHIRALFASPNTRHARAPLPGEKILLGVKASPGRATGIAHLGTAGRKPEDMEGCVLIAPSLSPEENSYIYHSSAIVSTGGGILSHAGLLAVQFRKPSLIVPGQWDVSRDGAPALLYATFDYEETEERLGGFTVTLRQDLRERQEVLREGDVVIVDADEGTLRVLGSERDALTLHEELRQLRGSGTRLAEAGSDAEVLALRGRRLRARHQLARLLGRVDDPVLARHAVLELLAGELGIGPPSVSSSMRGEKSELLKVLIENEAVGRIAGQCALETLRELENRFSVRHDEALQSMPEAEEAYEILSQRLDLLRLRRTLEGVRTLLRDCGLDGGEGPPLETGSVERLARERIASILDRLCGRLVALPEKLRPVFELRHLLRQIERLETVLPGAIRERRPLEEARLRLAEEDGEVVRELAGRPILRPADGGLELRAMIGSKAANLAEVDRLLGAGSVPEWFVVTDAALNELLDSPVGGDGPTLRAAIEGVLVQSETSHAQKSFLIRKLWQGTRLPESLEGDLIAAYRKLGGTEIPSANAPAEEPYVAVRSSGSEEDLEETSRAGEFATFLFVRGADSLIRSLKSAWAGLWTERAIHNRAVLGLGAVGAGGGLIVQRVVRSRVAGVLQTENVGEGRLRELVINAGLGLGEGIVSGSVGADQVVIAKGDDPLEEPLRFRYATNDKREKVVFDERRGGGTVRVETLYHERFRPALEYVEICELAATATRLEKAYGCPLDIEFAIEGTRIAILQVRPVVTFAAVLRETRDQYSLEPADGMPTHGPGGADGGRR